MSSSPASTSPEAPRFVPIAEMPRLHSVPRAEVEIRERRVVISLDDASERRLRLIFRPYQAVRVTTIDCFLVPPKSGFSRTGVSRVEGSVWLEELRAALARIDRDATFLQTATHYVIPAGDDVVEIVATGMEWEPVAGRAG